MSKGKPRANYREEKDGQVAKLKKALRRLESDNKKLRSELATYEAAFKKNIEFLKGKTKDLTLQELLEGAKKEQNLVKIEQVKEETYQEHKQRWKCHVCNAGVMKITVIQRQDGKHYFRKCNQPPCVNRTELKPFTDDVEIS